MYVGILSPIISKPLIFSESLHIPGSDDRRDFPPTEAVSCEAAKQSLWEYFKKDIAEVVPQVIISTMHFDDAHFDE